MSTNHIKSSTGYFKLAIVLFGIVILGVGLHSHFESAWRKYHIYPICNNPTIKKCPDISLERYYISIIIITFILSIIDLIASMLLDMKSGVLKIVDSGYHAMAAFLLVIGAIVYLVSTEQIYHLSDGWNVRGNLLRAEKLAAGVLTILHSLLYALAALQITRE